MGKVFACGGDWASFVKPQMDRTLDFTIGVFFDGTLNNKANIDVKKDFEEYKKSLYDESLFKGMFFSATHIPTAFRHAVNPSHNSEYTNVARSYKCFQKTNWAEQDLKEVDNFIIPIYVEGIGTKPRKVKAEPKPKEAKSKPRVCSLKKEEPETDDDEKDFDSSYDNLAWGASFGIGKYGVKRKVEAACKRVRDKVRKVINKIDLPEDDRRLIVNVNLYVFGFSRGAAAARCFSSGLLRDTGKTRCEFDFDGITDRAIERILQRTLQKENQCKTMLEQDWLDPLRKEFKLNLILLGRASVKFLGLYDTVSSYGADFNDDVEELSLDIGTRVSHVVQICAGDEYRKNFSLTNIASAAETGETIILPGSHSDIGGGYSHLKTEHIKKNFSMNGCKKERQLWEEGWYLEGETERTISNLYSVISFLLMKERIVDLDSAFIMDRLDEYRLPPLEGCEIDGLFHDYSEALCQFYEKLKDGVYDCCYRMEEGTVKSLSKEEFELSEKIKERQEKLKSPNLSYDTIWYYEELLEAMIAERDDLRQKLSSSDRKLLRKVRHDFLHLSAYSTFVSNAPGENNDRVVIEG